VGSVRRRTASPGSTQLLSVSSLARIRLCRNFVPVARRHRLIFVLRRVLRGPVNPCVSTIPTISGSLDHNSCIASERGLIRRKPLPPIPLPRPKQTYLPSLAEIAIVDPSTMVLEEARIQELVCGIGVRSAVVNDVVASEKKMAGVMRRPRRCQARVHELFLGRTNSTTLLYCRKHPTATSIRHEHPQARSPRYSLERRTNLYYSPVASPHGHEQPHAQTPRHFLERRTNLYNSTVASPHGPRTTVIMRIETCKNSHVRLACETYTDFAFTHLQASSVRARSTRPRVSRSCATMPKPSGMQTHTNITSNNC